MKIVVFDDLFVFLGARGGLILFSNEIPEQHDPFFQDLTSGLSSKVVRLAPSGWKKEHLQASDPVQTYAEESSWSISDKDSRSTWAKLIAQVYEVDPLECPRCGSPIRILAVITEPEEVRKILRQALTQL